MKSLKTAGVFFAAILLMNVARAQDYLPFTNEALPDVNKVRDSWIAPAAGYAFSTNALRVNISTGNLLLNRMGVYTTFEKGLDSDYFTNIYGVTVTVSPHLFLWGGMDLFTSRGIFNSFERARKEMGIGVMPWDDLIVNAGWSKAVGFTFSFGWKFPLGRV